MKRLKHNVWVRDESKREVITALVKQVNAQYRQGHCYRNAFITVNLHKGNPEIEFILGERIVPPLRLPMAHAWCRWQGIEFDPYGNAGMDIYVANRIYTKSEMWAHIYSCKDRLPDESDLIYTAAYTRAVAEARGPWDLSMWERLFRLNFGRDFDPAMDGGLR
jgi:hypothetical protein